MQGTAGKRLGHTHPILECLSSFTSWLYTSDSNCLDHVHPGREQVPGFLPLRWETQMDLCNSGGGVGDIQYEADSKEMVERKLH